MKKTFKYKIRESAYGMFDAEIDLGGMSMALGSGSSPDEALQNAKCAIGKRTPVKTGEIEVDLIE